MYKLYTDLYLWIFVQKEGVCHSLSLQNVAAVVFVIPQRQIVFIWFFDILKFSTFIKGE